MAEVERSFGSRRLILGFDAGCSTCSDLAERIEKAVGDKLEVRSLYDPQMEHWRKQALGEDAPWTPTLVEIKSGKVRAWTGPVMGLALGKRLGPKATWRIMQVLGDRNSSQNTRPRAVEDASSINRGQFLKGLVGALAAMSILPASAFASPGSPSDEARVYGFKIRAIGLGRDSATQAVPSRTTAR